MTPRQQDIVRVIIREELDRIIARMENEIVKLKFANSEAAERRRFKRGPFHLVEDDRRNSKIDALRVIIEAFKL